MGAATLALLEEAFNKRAGLRASTNALRLVNGYGDGLDGLVLEQYGQHFVAQVFDARWFSEKEALLGFVKGHGARYFIVKDRTRGPSARPDEIGFDVWLDGGCSSATVEESGVKFSVDLNDTLNTGLFLDMRANRRTVAAEAGGRKVLNLFSYTCSFGVHARLRGAASVVNVDVSKKILERGRVNYGLNALACEKNEFIRTDAAEYLARAVKKDNRFGMIILDPPSFSRHDSGTFSVKKDLPRLVQDAVTVLESGGVVFVATNHSEMLHSHLQNIVQKAARGRAVKKIRPFGQDVDFTGSGFMAESCLTAVLAEF